MLYIIIALLFLVSIVLAAVLYVVLMEASPIVERPLRDDQERRFFSAFSNTYFEARRKFREAAKAANAKLSTHLVCMDPESGLELTIDIAVLNAPPPNATKRNDTIVHLCGTHGVEGYAGSAIQIRALENMAKDAKNSNSNYDSSRPTIIFVHAVNPYGMANYRRFNENNVDLNRNCVATEQEWSILRSRGHNDFGYERFRPLFTPALLPRFWDRIMIFTTIAVYLLRFGFNTLKKTFVTGQYHHPEGIYYGGQRPEKSWCIIRDALSPYIGSTKTGNSNRNSSGVASSDKNNNNNNSALPPTRRLIIIDVHSGLGPSGVDTMMSDCKKDYMNAVDVFPSGCLVQEPTSAGADDASSGYDDAVGQTDLLALCHNHISVTAINSPANVKIDPTIVDNFKNQSKIYDFYLCITEEFGTVPPILVARSVMFENAAYQLSRGSPSHRMGQNMTRAAFYVESYAWKESVLRRGLERLDQAVDYFRKVEFH